MTSIKGIPIRYMWRPLGFALASSAFGLLAPVLVPAALLFARWDRNPSTDSHGECLTIRGDLPDWASWLSTPDERLPGGTYEPAVAAVFARRGRFWCSWYWLGIRNRGLGLDFTRAVPVTSPWPTDPGIYLSGMLWWMRIPVLGGRREFKLGWRTYALQGKYFAAPCLSFTPP